MTIDKEKMRAAGLEHARGKTDKKDTGKETAGSESTEKKEKKSNAQVLEKAVLQLEKIIPTLPKDSWERKRAQHTLASIQYAEKYAGKRGAPEGSYTVEVKGLDGKVAYAQYEGVPVDELINTLKVRAKEIRKEFTTLKVAELKKQLADLEYQYEKEPTIYSKIEVYKQIDVAKREYESTKKELEQDFPTAKELDTIAKELQDRSKGYFEAHYTKDHGEDDGIWLEAEKEKQDLRTRHEAKLISLDYRSTGSEEGDYKASMEVLKHRRELVLAEEKEEAVVEPEVPVAIKKPETTDVIIKEPTGVVLSEPVPVDTSPTPFENPEIKKTAFRIDLTEIAKRMAKVLTDARLDEHYANSGFFRKMTRALTEKHTRLELYDAAFKEIMKDQNLLKAMEGRSLSDQHLAGQQADDRGFFKRTLHIGSKEAAKKVATARAGASHTATMEDWHALIDSVFAEYEKEAVDEKSELGELLEVSSNPELQGQTEEMCVKYFRGEFKSRKELEDWARANLEPKAQALAKGKRFSGTAENSKSGEEGLFVMNWWQIAQDYKVQMDKSISEYKAKCKAEGKEVNEEDLRKNAKGRLALKMRLGQKDRDLANNRPEEFFQEYEKFKTRSGMWKVYDKYGPIGKVLASSYGSGLLTRGVVNAVSKRGLLLAGTVAGVGAFASFGVPIAVGAGLGAYYGWKRRKQQIDADIRHAQRYEALGGELSSVLDARKGLRMEQQMDAGVAIAELERIMKLPDLADADKQLLAGIVARMDIKKAGIADLITADEQTGKRFSSTQTLDSQLKILRKDLEKKFGLTGADWQKLVEDARKFLEADAKSAEKNIDKYEKWEAGKAAVVGFVAGAAGGIIGQKLAYGGVEWLTKKLGFHRVADYFASRGTTFDAASNYFKGGRNTDLALFPLESAPGSRIVIPGGSGGRLNSHEFLGSLAGKIPNGEVAEVHTQNWYDNTTYDEVTNGGSHAHSENELRLFVDRATSGDLKLRVPVQNGDSWLINGKRLVMADIDKAFHDGKIKMIFVPNGASSSEGIVCNVDPTTKEIDIPAGSDLQKLWDPTTNRFKGNGYFGLAEETGIRKDGSKNYTWINSVRGDGSEINFGEKAKVPDLVLENEEGYGYEMAPAMPNWGRKIYNKGKEKNKKEVSKKDGKAKPEKVSSEAKVDTKKHAGSEKVETTSKVEAKAEKEVAMKKAKHLVGVASDSKKTDDEVYKAYVDLYATEGDFDDETQLEIETLLKGSSPVVLNRLETAHSRVVSEEGEIDLDSDSDVDEPTVTKATTSGKDKGTEVTAPAKEGAAKPVLGKTEKPVARTERRVTPETKTDFEIFGKEFDSLINSTEHKVHMTNPDSRQMSEKDVLRVFRQFRSALNSLPEEVRIRALNRVNKTEEGPFNKGLILAFPQSGVLGFDKQDRLLLPVNATTESIKAYLMKEFGK